MILSVGVYLTVTNTSFSFVTGNSILSGTVLLAVSGIITVIVAILGIFGSLLSNRWLLTVVSNLRMVIRESLCLCILILLLQ